MATSIGQCEYKLDILNCTICNNKFIEPKTLQCFHSFCSKCVDGLSVISENEIEKYSCPVCEKLTNKDKVRINHVLNELCSAETSLFDLEKTCIYCRNVAATKCNECDGYYCCKCKENLHDKVPGLKLHKIEMIRQVVEPKMPLDKVVFCAEHTDLALTVNCVECKKLICSTCQEVSHQGHPTLDLETSLKQALTKYKELKCKFQRLSVDTDVFDKRYIQAQRVLEDREQEIEQTCTAIKAKLEADKNDLVNFDKQQFNELEKHVKCLNDLIAIFEHLQAFYDVIRSSCTGVILLQEILSTKIIQRMATIIGVMEFMSLPSSDMMKELQEIFETRLFVVENAPRNFLGCLQTMQGDVPYRLWSDLYSSRENFERIDLDLQQRNITSKNFEMVKDQVWFGGENEIIFISINNGHLDI